MFWKKSERDAALVAELDEVGALQGALGEEDAVVGDDADRMAVEVGEAADERLAVVRLELAQLAAVDDAAQDLARRRRGRAGRSGRRERSPRGRRRAARGSIRCHGGAGGGRQRGDDLAHDRAAPRRRRRRGGRRRRTAGVDVAAAELLRGHLLAGRRLHQRRAAEEDRALVADDHGLVAHRRHVGAAGGAGAHHRGDLRDPRADIVAWLQKMRPKWSRSGKTSSCSGRKAPPESTR